MAVAQGIKMKFLDFVIRLFIDDSTKERLKREGKDSKGFRGILRVFLGHFHQFTLYNPLGLISGIVFTGTLFYPWWFASVYNNYSTIRAYPVVLRHNLPPDGLEFVIETPQILVSLLILSLAGYLFLGQYNGREKGEIIPGLQRPVYALLCRRFLWFHSVCHSPR
jgi:hypothetical protein